MNKKEIEATNRLAAALDKLADRLEKFTDPLTWQKTLSDAVRMMPFMSAPVARLRQLQGGPVAIPSVGFTPTTDPLLVSVNLSEEERTLMVEKINTAIQPQLAEFTGFVRQSLVDMPAHRLKKIADKVDAGVTPQLERRKGCVFIKADGEESYLGL
jgi:hypothetical protein